MPKTKNTYFLNLIDKFGTPYEIYRATEEDYYALDDVPEDIVARLCDKSLHRACKIMDDCAMNGYGIITYYDKEYPLTLKNIIDPPMVLYYQGKWPDVNRDAFLGIVGTRSMSEYGMKSAYKISYELAAAGIIIVSGMAYGIDSVSACAALAANGTTVAVLGCGLNTTYPASHTTLRRAIAKHGVIISEYPPDVGVERMHFPRRNRIISGLCSATFIVEAGAKSGALITAKEAMFQGRKVFAMPGNVGDENTDGTNRLIRDGIYVVLESDDIYNEYEPLYYKVTDRIKMLKAKKHSDFDEGVLKRYGVRSAESLDSSDGAKRDETYKNYERPSYASKNVTSQTSKATEKESHIKDDQIEQPSNGYAEDVLSTLDDIHRTVYSMFKQGSPMLLDNFVSVSENTGDIIAALTTLEIMGLIRTMPGGIYVRL